MDLSIAALAAAQHGVVSRAQLLTLGLGKDRINHRLRTGRLHAIHRGVYAAGHPVLTIEGRWMAAVLAAGRDAVLSHASAATAWALRQLGAGAIHVTIPGDPGRKRRQGIRIHRSTTLTRGTPPPTAVYRSRPPPARSSISPPASRVARSSTHSTSLTNAASSTSRSSGRDQSHAPYKRCCPATTPSFTRSELEERFFGLCDKHGLPRPSSNTRIEGEEVDFVWRDKRLIVEVDGYRYHRSPSAFEDDRRRDVMLSLAGWQVLRFTWTQITQRPAWVAGAISRRLAL